MPDDTQSDVLPVEGTGAGAVTGEYVQVNYEFTWHLVDDTLRIGLRFDNELVHEDAVEQGHPEIRRVFIDRGFEQVVAERGGTLDDGTEVWQLTLPAQSTLGRSVEVRAEVRFPITTADGDEAADIGQLEFVLTAPRFPAITFRLGLEGFIVVQGDDGSYRFSPLDPLATIANRRVARERLYNWESLPELTADQYEQLTLIAGLEGYLENVVFSDESVAREFLDEQFAEMESAGRLSQVITLDTTRYLVSTHLRGGLSVVVPNPGDNYRAAQAEADKLFDTDRHPAERAAAGAAMFGYAVFTVVDVIPGLGKADDAVDAVRQSRRLSTELGDGLRRQAEQARRLAEMEQFSDEARDLFRRTADELDGQAESLSRLGDDLEGLDPNDLSDEQVQELMDTFENLGLAREYRRRAAHDIDSAYRGGPSATVDAAARRREAAETVSGIMRSLPDDEARTVWRSVADALPSNAPRLDEDVVLTYLRSQGQLTQDGLERFGRRVTALSSEQGKTQLRDLLEMGPLGPDQIGDLGFEGKRFEALIAAFGEHGDDLNDVLPNFRVVDYVSRVDGQFGRGNIYSVCRGRADYLVKKVRRLFNQVPADEDNFAQMLRDLRGNGVLTRGPADPAAADLAALTDEFTERARLLVPNDYVDPLRAMILGRQTIPRETRERMAAAVTSELAQ